MNLSTSRTRAGAWPAASRASRLSFSNSHASSNAPRIAPALAWSVVLSLALYFLVTSVLPYAQVRADVYSYLWPKRGWLWVHLAGGVPTLLLGWLQFVAPLRRKWPRVHRWSGRAYLVALTVAAIGATALVWTTPLGWTTAYAFAVMIGAWGISALMGWRCIRHGDVDAHRDWMRRNYIVTLGFVTFRLAGKVPGLYALGTPPEVFTTFVWMSWTVPMLLSEAFVGLRRLHARPLPATAGATP